MEDLGWGYPAEDLAGTFVNLVHVLVELVLGQVLEVGAFGEVGGRESITYWCVGWRV